MPRGGGVKYIKMISITSFCSGTANKDSLLVDFEKYTLKGEGRGLTLIDPGQITKLLWTPNYSYVRWG